MKSPASARPVGAFWLGCFLFLILFLATSARAEIDFKIGGTISSDIRFRLLGDELPAPFPALYRPAYPSQYLLLKNGFSRNENLIKTKASIGIGSKVKAVVDVDLYLYGYSDLKDIDGLTLREKVDPYRLEVTSAYVDIYKILPGLDLRIGRQVVVWGAADKFNPTSNVTTLDFSDPLLFGKGLGNNMVRADWNPVGDLVVTAVLVPIFRPGQLPRTAPLALLDATRPLSIQNDMQLNSVYNLQQVYNPSQINVITQIPDPSLANMQEAIRIAGHLWGQDVSISYYHGRFGFPVPSLSIVKQGPTPGQPVVDVGVVWPRMDVVGADIAGTIPKLGGLGYWVEGAVTFPQQVEYTLYNDISGHAEERFRTDSVVVEPIRIDKNNLYEKTPPGSRPIINDTTPFLKFTVGADMSLGSHVYLNLQYVHGFFDEFGAGYALHPPRLLNDPLRKEQRIGDYMVAGLDLKLAGDTVLLRFFGVIKIPSVDVFHGFVFDQGFLPTAVLFPMLTYQVWDGTELAVGGFIFIGDRTSKFGDPAAGASEVFGKLKFTY